MRPALSWYQSQIPDILPEEKTKTNILIPIGEKILNKMLVNQIQQHVKESCTMTKWNLALGCKDNST